MILLSNTAIGFSIDSKSDLKTEILKTKSYLLYAQSCLG